ncbi:MAG: hypothetical protein FNT15_00530 [Sulfurovum sp.]|nr:MAG: hypothetical protein FNT15_00530 [Sulfurovum sp.]
MNTKFKLSNHFKNFHDFVLNIQNYFDNSSETIHKARNELKIINYNGIDTVVKAFKIPNFINQIVYAYFRESKAKKSYEYSLKIGEFTPKPIGYIEFYEMGLLKESYFISEKFSYDFTIREPLLDKDFLDKENILKSFAHFTYLLHENNILHQDYSPGNILVKKEIDNYIFKIVDINRMQFISLDLKKRLKNFSKLWMSDADLKIVATEYGKIINKNKEGCIKIALKFSHNHKNKINMKKRLKGIKVVD